MDELERLEKSEAETAELKGAETPVSNEREEMKRRDREGRIDVENRGSSNSGEHETRRPCKRRRQDHGFRSGGEERNGQEFRTRGEKCVGWRRDDDRPSERRGHGFHGRGNWHSGDDRSRECRGYGFHGNGCGGWNPDDGHSYGGHVHGQGHGDRNRNDDRPYEGRDHGCHWRGCASRGARGHSLR